MRDSWRSVVSTKEEFLKRTRVEAVTADIKRAPVNLHNLAYRLGARIEKRRSIRRRDGVLDGDRGNWVIAVRDDSLIETPRERFTVAHELAHILFIEAGLDPPVTKGGYWILEEACHRIASDLLVPAHLGPKGYLQAKELLWWMYGLTRRWSLSREAAAKCIVRRSTNTRSVAGLACNQRYEDRLTVDWCLNVNDRDPWPGRATRVAEDRFSELGVLLEKHYERRVHRRTDTIIDGVGAPESDTATAYISKTNALGGILVGFELGDIFTVFRQDRDHAEQMRLFETLLPDLSTR